MINLPSIEDLTPLSRTDAFFRALISKELGSTQLPDDELMDLIVASPLLGNIYEDLYNTSAGKAKIANTVAASYSNSTIDLDQTASARVVWSATALDPRFSLIVKQALDDARLPPRSQHLSRTGGIVAMLGKIRDALLSAGEKHSNTTLLAAILAALLAGGAADHLIVPAVTGGSTSSCTAPCSEHVVAALNNIAQEIQAQSASNTAISRLDVQMSGVSEHIDELNTSDKAINLQLQQQMSQVNALQANMVQNAGKIGTMQGDLGVLTGILNSQRLQHIEDYMQRIAFGLAEDPLTSIKAAGPVTNNAVNPGAASSGAQSKTAKYPATIQSNLESIAQSFGPVTATDQVPGTPGNVPIVSLNQAIAESRQSAVASFQNFRNQFAGYMSAQVHPQYAEVKVSKTGPFSLSATNKTGSPCVLNLNLVSVSRKSAAILVAQNNCGIAAQNVPMVLDDHPKWLPGSVIELKFDLPYRPHFWSLWTKGATISSYSSPLSQ